MSVSRTYRCLSCRLKGFTDTKYTSTRHFSSTARQQKKSPHKSITQAQMQARIEQASLSEDAQPYTPREKQLLAMKYTPEQLEAIYAAEALIPADGIDSTPSRKDKTHPRYFEDYATIRPLVDKPVRPPIEDIDPNIRERTHQETLTQLQKWHSARARQLRAGEARANAIEMGQAVDDPWAGPLGKRLEDPNLSPKERREILMQIDTIENGYEDEADTEIETEWIKMVTDPNTYMYSPKGTIHSQSDVLAPEIPKFRSKDLYWPNEDEDPTMTRLFLQTGLDKREIRRLRIKVLVAHRVVNQTRMGKVQSQYFLTIAGNEDGMVGVGEGKAVEVEDGRRQAMMAAIRNMRPIPRYEDRTIYGEVEAKVGASIVQLSARPPGFGNRCQHLIYELARAAGLQDLAARTPRSRNPMNVVKAAWEALTSQTLPEDVARARGRKLVDVRKVYYGGQVP